MLVTKKATYERLISSIGRAPALTEDNDSIPLLDTSTTYCN